MIEQIGSILQFLRAAQAEQAAQWLFNYQVYAVVALLLLASLVRPAYRWTRKVWVSLGHDFFYGVVHTLIFYPLLVGCTAGLQAAIARWAPWLNMGLYQRLPGTAQVLLAIAIADFLQFISHYCRHKWRLLWHFHVLHHSQEQMNPFTTKRTHVVEGLFSRGVIMVLPLAIMGSPPKIWVAYYLLDAVWDYLIHSNLRLSFGPLKYIVVSPLYHRLHHSSLPRHYDKNFGDRFVIWDLLFGTACFDFTDHPTGVNCPEFQREERIGLPYVVITYARQWLYPFRMVWRDMLSARRPPVESTISILMESSESPPTGLAGDGPVRRAA
jgi:sterol desaturase/sphingolipid hydroxylase (fatty acid hydroxylase superfamily)